MRRRRSRWKWRRRKRGRRRRSRKRRRSRWKRGKRGRRRKRTRRRRRRSGLNGVTCRPYRYVQVTAVRRTQVAASCMIWLLRQNRHCQGLLQN